MISSEQLEQLMQDVEASGLDEARVIELRKQYEGTHFTYCMDDDVIYPKAYAERNGFNVYLVDSSDHCSKITSAVEYASGVVLAEVIED
ncbi:MAG: hypothetical protein ACPGYX_01315 [Oceanobacter sp.]